LGRSTEIKKNDMHPALEELMTETLVPFAENIADTPFEAYEGTLTADPTALQNQAMAGYGSLEQPGSIAAAANVFSELASRDPQAQADRVAGYTQQYASNVIDPTINAMEAQRAKARNMEAANRATSKAFGSRGDVYQGALEGEYQVGLAQTLGNLQNQALQYGTTRADTEDAARRAAAQGLSSIGQQQFGNQLSTLSAQMGAGEALRKINEQKLQLPYQQYMMQQQYPLTQFGVLTGAAGAFPNYPNQVTGTTSDPFTSAGNLLAGFGAFGKGFGFGR
jgi:hypothetical protein